MLRAGRLGAVTTWSGGPARPRPSIRPTIPGAVRGNESEERAC
jgi:hypothetical protein